MASRQRPKRRKTVPSAKEQQAASVRSLDGVEAPLKPTDVEAAHERREQARAVEDMASRAATASQLERATCRLERYQKSIRSSSVLPLSNWFSLNMHTCLPTLCKGFECLCTSVFGVGLVMHVAIANHWACWHGLKALFARLVVLACCPCSLEPIIANIVSDEDELPLLIAFRLQQLACSRSLEEA